MQNKLDVRQLRVERDRLSAGAYKDASPPLPCVMRLTSNGSIVSPIRPQVPIDKKTVVGDNWNGLQGPDDAFPTRLDIRNSTRCYKLSKRRPRFTALWPATVTLHLPRLGV